jgi:hypothetical protein
MSGTLKKCLCLICGFATAMFATPVMGVEVRNAYRLTLSSGEPCSARSLFVVVRCILPSFHCPFADSLVCGVLFSLPTCAFSLVCWQETVTAPVRVSRVPCSSVVHSRSFSIPCLSFSSPARVLSLSCVLDHSRF